MRHFGARSGATPASHCCTAAPAIGISLPRTMPSNTRVPRVEGSQSETVGNPNHPQSDSLCTRRMPGQRIAGQAWHRNSTQGLSDLPMVAERVHQPTEAPAVGLVTDRPDDGGTFSDRPGKDLVGIRNSQNHPHRAAAQGFRAEIPVCRGFVRHPKFRAVHGQLGHDPAGIIGHAKQFLGTPGPLVKFNGLGTTTDRQDRCNRRF